MYSLTHNLVDQGSDHAAVETSLWEITKYFNAFGDVSRTPKERPGYYWTRWRKCTCLKRTCIHEFPYWAVTILQHANIQFIHDPDLLVSR